MDSCRHSCVKYFVLVFNLLFALAGLTIVGLGAYMQKKQQHSLNSRLLSNSPPGIRTVITRSPSAC